MSIEAAGTKIELDFHPWDAKTAHAWIMQDRANRLADDVVERVLMLVGRNEQPKLLLFLSLGDSLPRSMATKWVGPAWSSAEFPDRHMTRKDWLSLFALAGFTIDGVPTERPTEPVRLYRGACPEARKNWSWTDNLEVAQKYASGFYYRTPGHVYTAMVPPKAMLAINHDREEFEYVVNTARLKIEEMPSGAMSVHAGTTKEVPE